MPKNSGEGDFEEKMVPLTLGGLEDDDGNTADMAFVDALMLVESHIEAYRKRHYDNLPEKPYKLTLEVNILPTSKGTRAISWKFCDVKTPAMAKTHLQYGRAHDGMLFAVGLQHKLPFTMPTDDEEE